MEALLALCVVAVVFGIAAAGVYGWWYLSEVQVAKRQLSGTSSIQVREAREGDVVKISGRVEIHEKTLRAPLSARECVYYDVKIEEQVNDLWSQLVGEQKGCSFYVVDETGRALVEGAHLEAVLVRDHTRASGLFNDATPDLKAFLARHGEKSTGFLGLNNKLRYLEGVLSPGEKISVIGRARWRPDPTPNTEGSYRGEGAKRLVLVAPSRDERVFATDDPRLTT